MCVRKLTILICERGTIYTHSVKKSKWLVYIDFMRVLQPCLLHPRSEVGNCLLHSRKTLVFHSEEVIYSSQMISTGLHSIYIYSVLQC